MQQTLSEQAQQQDSNVEIIVTQKNFCPHIDLEKIDKLTLFCQKKYDSILQMPCKECKNTSGNSICLTCMIVCCRNKHMETHHKKSHHPMFLFFSDISLMCCQCQSLIQNRLFQNLVELLTEIKLKQEKDNIERLNQQMQNLRIDDKFTYEQFISGVKEKKYQNICIIAGAGMSVAAGIPDFRTPGTGLYSQLEKYHLPYPEIIFQLEFFKRQPQVFYQVAKEFLLSFNAKPTLAHHLLKWLDSRNQLAMCYTQNIDGLEIDVGVALEKVIQAHGHMRTAHCVQCKKEAAIQEFMEHIKNDKIHICKICQKGLIKPDVVFFGEELPSTYFKSIECLSKSDLVLIIGTSLKVMPFAAIVQLIPKQAPIVLLNKENVLQRKENVLHLEGDIEMSSRQILNDLQ